MKGAWRLGASFVGVVAGMAILLVLLPSGAQAKKDPSYASIAPASATGVLQFVVTLELEDKSEWSYDTSDLCTRTTGSGSHTIKANLANSLQYWDAYLPVKRTTKGKVVPLPTVTGNLIVDPDSDFIPGFGPIPGPPEPQKGTATYTIDAAAPVTEILNTSGACAPNTCDDCTSDPPVWRCGSETGTVELDSLGGSMSRNGKVSNIELLDDWLPANPFNQEGSRSYCSDDSLWAWTNGFPALYTAEGDQLGIELQNSRLLGYFKIDPKKRTKCAGKLRKFCEKRASYTRTTKTLQRVATDEPGNVSLRTQTSTFTMNFGWVKYTPLKRR